MEKKNHYFIDVHVLQTVPPSCVNRDDTGSPKTAVYGGVTRARVSSQAWKYAMRKKFMEDLDPERVGKRTKLIVDMVKDEILRRSPDIAVDTAEKQATKALNAAGLSIKDAKKGTNALFFMSIAQARALAQLAIEGNFDKNLCKAALAEAPSIDMALFGRMVASDSSLNYDAAAQVAHSISTHAVHNEYDYFTAVDDYQAKAVHLGTVEYNSSTLYRYATVSLGELYRSLGSEAVTAVRNFLNAFIWSMPTGKQNSFANETPPDAVYVAIRSDQPVNLCGAFEKPVQSGTEGYSLRSQRELVSYAKKFYSEFAAEPDAAFVTSNEMASLVKPCSLPELLDGVEKWLKERVFSCEVQG